MSDLHESVALADEVISSVWFLYGLFMFMVCWQGISQISMLNLVEHIKHAPSSASLATTMSRFMTSERKKRTWRTLNIRVEAPWLVNNVNARKCLPCNPLITCSSHCCLQHPGRTIPVIVIGVLVFLPGFYHLRIAYYAAKGYRGYSYDDIPDFGDWLEESGEASPHHHLPAVYIVTEYV